MGYNVAIVGGSLTGLAAGTVLHRLGHTFTIFEKFHAPFSDRGSSLGFVDIALWQHLTGRQMTRYDAQAHRSQGAYFYGDLWTFLYNGLPAGSVQFGQEVTDLGSDPLRPVVQGQPFDAVIVADGGWSKLRQLVTGNVNGRVRSIATWEASCATLSAARSAASWVASSAGSTVALCGQRRHADVAEAPLPPWFMPLMRRTFRTHGRGQLLQWLELCNTPGTGKITPQPLYEFAADKVVNGRLILMGDSAHMASPRTAAGAHTGILDAAGLLEALSAHPNDIDDAIRAYGPGGLQRARDLYQRSKEVSKPLVYVPGDDDYKREL